MKELDHILRPSLPWREGDGGITECGFNASAVKTLTRAELFERLKDLGKQRTAMLVCMTCSDTARRWGTWEDDPRLAMQREIEWERGSAYWRARNDRGHLLRDELTAVADLIEKHRSEFDAAVNEIQERRSWNEKKAALAASRPKAPKPNAGL